MKRNQALKLLILLTLIIALVSNGYSQTSSSRAVRKEQQVAFLIERNIIARALIDAAEKRINDLETELALERENSASVQKSYDSAKKEIAFLQQSNEALTRAVALNEQTIEMLKADNDKQRQAAKKARKDKWKAYGVAAAAIALKLLLP